MIVYSNKQNDAWKVKCSKQMLTFEMLWNNNNKKKLEIGLPLD